MRTAKCPACQRRFSTKAEPAECARCGADLFLLIKLHNHADQLICQALSNPSLQPLQRIEGLKKAQRICRSAEAQALIEAFSPDGV
jgi:hypothetical protein